MRIYGEEGSIKLMWNYASGEGFILIDGSFEDLPDVTKLDMLKDWIAELQEEYDDQRQFAFGDDDA